MLLPSRKCFNGLQVHSDKNRNSSTIFSVLPSLSVSTQAIYDCNLSASAIFNVLWFSHIWFSEDSGFLHQNHPNGLSNTELWTHPENFWLTRSEVGPQVLVQGLHFENHWPRTTFPSFTYIPSSISLNIVLSSHFPIALPTSGQGVSYHNSLHYSYSNTPIAHCIIIGSLAIDTSPH